MINGILNPKQIAIDALFALPLNGEINYTRIANEIHIRNVLGVDCLWQSLHYWGDIRVLLKSKRDREGKE